MFILFVVLAKLNNNKYKLVLRIKVCPKLLESLCLGVFGSGVSYVYVISAMKVFNCTQNIYYHLDKNDEETKLWLKVCCNCVS